MYLPAGSPGSQPYALVLTSSEQLGALHREPHREGACGTPSERQRSTHRCASLTLAIQHQNSAPCVVEELLLHDQISQSPVAIRLLTRLRRGEGCARAKSKNSSNPAAPKCTTARTTPRLRCTYYNSPPAANNSMETNPRFSGPRRRAAGRHVRFTILGATAHRHRLRAHASMKHRTHSWRLLCISAAEF